MRSLIQFVAVLTFCLSISVAEAQNKVVVVPLGKSGLKAVNDSSSCDASKAGTIRWTGTDFEGCNGMTWIVFTMPYGTVTSQGQVWLDRNLGASRVATSGSDSAAYGDLYQWGRLTDGHEQRTSLTTGIQSTTDVPGHGKFIMMYPYWRNPQNDNLWKGVAGTNNPCPAGFRLPTAAEWEIERASWSSSNAAGAFASPLKLVLAGWRDRNDGIIAYGGSYAQYWSSTVEGSYISYFQFKSDYAGADSTTTAFGFSVRCLKD